MQTKQDEKLDEVRAILQRLQRISTGTEDDAATERAAVSPTPAASTSEPPPQALPRARRLKPASIAIVAVAGLLLIGAAGLALWPDSGPPPAIEAAPRTAPAAAIAEPPRPIAALTIPASPPAVPAEDAERLAAAQSLMDGGKVAEARQLLLADFAERSADAALLLARSYDPNALQQIAVPNAAADADEAERWYRHWSMIAGREGLALDEDRLDRIIRSMR